MHIALEELVGFTASRSLELLFSSLEEVKEVKLAPLRPLRPIQSRLDLSPAERKVFDKALELRHLTGVSFWDAVLLQVAAFPDAFRLLDIVMTHVSLKGEEFIVSKDEIASGGLERACDAFKDETGASLTILSEVVRCDGSIAHLPMLDFHAFKSEPNLRIVKEVAARLLPDGAIVVDSGESYHSYGTRLCSEDEFRSFLGEAMLFAPITDRAYLAHQLIEGRCALRLSPGGGKRNVPIVVAAIPAKSHE